MVVEIFKAPACRVGGGASKNGGEAVNFCEYWEICLKETEFKAITILQASLPHSEAGKWKSDPNLH